MRLTHNVKSLTLSLSSGSAYAANDVLADRQELENVFLTNGGRATLQSLVVLDKDDQAGALDVVFLNANNSLGTENSAVSITDANMESCVAVVSVASSDYDDFINSQIACKDNIDTLVSGPSDDTSLWVGAVSRDTKTYTGSGIVLKIGFKDIS
jgi:hypothetical protein